MWVDNKKQKIDYIKESIVDKDANECTFKP